MAEKRAKTLEEREAVLLFASRLRADLLRAASQLPEHRALATFFLYVSVTSRRCQMRVNFVSPSYEAKIVIDSFPEALIRWRKNKILRPGIQSADTKKNGQITNHYYSRAGHSAISVVNGVLRPYLSDPAGAGYTEFPTMNLRKF